MAEPLSSSTTASLSPQFSQTLIRREIDPPKPADNDDCESLSSLCIPGSKLVRTGFVRSACSDDKPVLFVNAGGEALMETRNVGFRVENDKFFQGGSVIRTDETIEGSDVDVQSIYQSARFGNFAYRFENLSPGDYFVDLHFSEIIYSNGPKGMRVFDVFMQEEKVLSEIDIYSVVGANKALQVIDVRVAVGEDGVIVIRFEGVNGSPIVSGICIKRARLPASKVKHGSLVCNNCAAEIEISSGQEKYIRMQFIAKYEKKIEELKTRFQLKTDECHEAWMSLTTANKQLQDVTMELDNKLYTIHCLDQVREETEAKLRDISGQYEHDKRMWTEVVDKLEREVKLMKQEYYQLYCEVHKCADAIPELSNMVSAVQAMVTQCEDLKFKLSEEQAKRKILYNQIQEAKGNIRVFCRCRPLRKEESLAGHATVVHFDAAKDGELGIISSGSNKKIFKFDRVYTPEDDQVDVFADASPMIVSVLDGYNVCIFAYGQTGTGKTFTMEGPESNRGVNYRTLEQLFITAEERKETYTYNISVSVLEFIAKYEKKIEELKTRFQLKSDECHEAWMSLTTANKQLQDVTMELDNKLYTIHCLDQAREETEAKLRDISGQYEHDKRMWTEVVDKLEREVKLMKQEYYQLYCEVHKCADAIPELSNMVSAVQAMVTQCEDLKFKLSEEQAKRKILYNQIQEAKGNIRVFCRCRPLRKEESLAGHATVVHFDAAKDGELGIISSGSNKKIFKFDRVYTPEDDQVDVFADASPMIVSVLDGYNVCIFAYGQTGTGKTFTMEGPESNRGVNYRTLEQLFITAEERKETSTYNISVSVLEVYNEQIRDLLANSSTSKRLEMRQASEGIHHIPGVIEAKVENINEVWSILQAGSNARTTGSNNVNEHSSRSHCILCIMVRAKNLMTGDCTMSKLWLVDLAGSERLAKTEVQGDRLKEAQNINRSLSALGDVISALAAKKSHIPYRNSKLTHLLQDSLGGDAKTLMFVQVSPSEQDLNETLSSLNFAARVRGVELGPARKQVDTGEVQKLRNQNDKLKQELRSKEDAFRKLEENFQNLEGKAKGDYQMCRSQQDKINELEKQIALKIDFSRRLEHQLLEANEKAEASLDLQKKVKELENKQKEREHAYPTILQNKVKDLENKLKEKTQELEHHSAVAQWKVQELEEKLAMKENNKGFQLLQQKVKELEEKLRQQEQVHASSAFSTENSEATPNQTKECFRHETVADVNPLSQRSFSYSNQMTDNGSALLKVPESLHEIRRKREFRSKGHENNFILPATLTDGNMFSSEPNRGKSGTQKALARITRSIKPASTTHKTFPNNRNDRDQVPAVKSRIWLR